MLEREIGDRRILRQDSDHGFVRARPVDDVPTAPIPAWMRDEVAIEPEPVAIEPVGTAHDLSPEEVLARLEHIAAGARSRRERGRPSETRLRLSAATFSTSH
jgi:hypothetical protein